jgi:hypothetical protein
MLMLTRRHRRLRSELHRQRECGIPVKDQYQRPSGKKYKRGLTVAALETWEAA